MHRTRRRTLLAIGGCARGPALRDAPTDAPADGTTGGGATDPTDAGETPATDATDWKAKHDQAVAHSRKWEDRAKANTTAAAELAKVGDTFKQLFGLDKATPEQLTEHLTKAQTDAQTAAATAAEAQVELLVFRTAGKAGVDAERLLDSRSFLDEVDDIEAENVGEFKTKLEALVKAALKKDPRLAVQQPAGKLGADHAGSGGSGSIDEQIAAATKAGDHARAIALKRQKAYTTG